MTQTGESEYKQVIALCKDCFFEKENQRLWYSMENI